VKYLQDPIYEYCVLCGEGMETGSIGSESLIFGLQWFSGNRKGIGGEVLRTPDNEGMVFLRAYRCRNCKIVYFRY